MENKEKLFEESVSEFDEIFKRAKKVKERIEEENKKLNISYKEVKNKLTTYFNNEHLNLDIKEKKIKNELDEKVEKTREELNEFLKETKNIILSCEKIHNLIEDYNEKSYNSEIKTFHCVSEITKNNEKADESLKKPIKGLDITYPPNSLFNNEKDTPTYYYYVFSGIPVPKIGFIYKNEDLIKINWDIELLRLQYKNLKYLVEVKEEGNDNISSFTVDYHNMEFKYKNDTTYEVKVRTIIDGFFGEYSEIKTFNEKDL